MRSSTLLGLFFLVYQCTCNEFQPSSKLSVGAINELERQSRLARHGRSGNAEPHPNYTPYGQPTVQVAESPWLENSNGSKTKVIEIGRTQTYQVPGNSNFEGKQSQFRLINQTVLGGQLPQQSSNYPGFNQHQPRSNYQQQQQYPSNGLVPPPSQYPWTVYPPQQNRMMGPQPLKYPTFQQQYPYSRGIQQPQNYRSPNQQTPQLTAAVQPPSQYPRVVQQPRSQSPEEVQETPSQSSESVHQPPSQSSRVNHQPRSQSSRVNHQPPSQSPGVVQQSNQNLKAPAPENKTQQLSHSPLFTRVSSNQIPQANKTRTSLSIVGGSLLRNKPAGILLNTMNKIFNIIVEPCSTKGSKSCSPGSRYKIVDEDYNNYEIDTIIGDLLSLFLSYLDPKDYPLASVQQQTVRFLENVLLIDMPFTKDSKGNSVINVRQLIQRLIFLVFAEIGEITTFSTTESSKPGSIPSQADEAIKSFIKDSIYLLFNSIPISQQSTLDHFIKELLNYFVSSTVTAPRDGEQDGTQAPIDINVPEIIFGPRNLNETTRMKILREIIPKVFMQKPHDSAPSKNDTLQDIWQRINPCFELHGSTCPCQPTLGIKKLHKDA